MRRVPIKLVAAPTIALLLLGLVWAWLARAAPAQPAPIPPTAPKQAGDTLAWVSVVASPTADVERFFVGPVYRRAVGGLQRLAGYVPSSVLPNLAAQPGVVRIPSSDPPPLPPQPNLDLPGKPVPDQNPRAIPQLPESSPDTPGSWYENDTQGVRETWNTLGLTGTGVTIAVLDSGVDFGNPALTGRYAIQPSTLSGTQAYAGWPTAFDDRSLATYVQAPARAWPENWGWYVNAAHAITGSGQFTFTHLLSPTHVCTAPGTSLSGRYLLGYHPDPALDSAPVLAADEAVSATYDAVYMDLDHDGSFETRMDKGNPVGALDLTGDGVQDVSAGLLYWIADGANPPPGAEAVYGSGVPVPAAGTLLAFMIDTIAERGGGHGTMCAGTAVGHDGDVFTTTSEVASFYDPAAYGPLVQGPAPGARVIAVGNVYEGGSVDAWYLFTVMGYDGVPGSGDEPQIVTLSFGGGDVDNDGWDWESRYLTHLNLTYGERSPLFVHSAGNGGFGYGTLIQPNPATGLIVGASTQYGTYNAWGISETVSLSSRTNAGDVASFSGRGPGADGIRAVDLVANGMLGTGAYPLNYFYAKSLDGTQAYVHWKGTSRSAPVVGGMAALTAQAFRQAHDRFPTYEELRLLLVNGARDLGYDPLVQGAGQANAFRSAQVALAQYGITVDPPAAMAGDFRGARHPAFANGLSRGQAQALTFTVANPGSAAITVTLDARHLVEVARYITTVQTITDTATNDGDGVPDYAVDLTSWVAAHPEADLMVVRMTVPFEHFDTLPPTPSSPRNSWRLMVYNWWDDDVDGRWWTDLNGDGQVDWPGEIDGEDEWLRFGYSDYSTRSTYNYLNGTQQEVRVGRPYTRSLGANSGGIWAGASHITRSGGDNRTTLTFEVVFYHRAGWPEVALSTGALYLPAGGRAVFRATVTVPTDAPYGLYQGIIVVTDTGRTDLVPAYRPHRTIVPLTWQVWPDAAAGATLGGTACAGTPYDGGWIGGGFGWVAKESGDWRFYGFDLQDPPPGGAILAHSVWEDYPTDLDTIILGPSPDEFSDAAPAWFGPYGLDWVGGTARTGSPGAWAFSTLTGGTEDWASAPARDGLHVLAHQSVLFGGHQSATIPFTTSLGLLHVQPYPLRIDPAACGLSCTVTLNLHATLDVDGGITGTHGFGWFSPVLTPAQAISQGQFVTHGLVLTTAAYRVDVELANVAGATRLDACLYDDGGSLAGQWDPGDGLLSCARAPGEVLREHVLAADQHWVRVEGTQVSSPPASYDLRILIVPESSGGALSFGDLPADVQVGQAYTFTVHVDRAPAVGQQGLLVLGPPLLPEALEVEVLAVSKVYLPMVVKE